MPKNNAFSAGGHRAVLDMGIGCFIEKNAILAPTDFKVFNAHMRATHKENLTGVVNCLIICIDEVDEGFTVHGIVRKDISRETDYSEACLGKRVPDDDAIFAVNINSIRTATNDGVVYYLVPVIINNDAPRAADNSIITDDILRGIRSDTETGTIEE